MNTLEVMYEHSNLSTEIAKETERPKSFHIQKALEAYLTELADLQVAYDRLHDTADPIISIGEMRKELEL
jgi:RHH-type rel operon transcriptional repressor/antitoxin RelB